MSILHHPLMAARRWALALICLLGAHVAWAVDFEMDPLPPDAVASMSADARTLYEKGMGQFDRINYGEALDYFNQAVAKAPDNMPLRFMQVRLARYMGDTAYGADATEYYDQAALNLRAMADSNKLNARERERAAKSLQDVAALKASVGERDDKRVQFGRGIDKLYLEARAGKADDTSKDAKSKNMNKKDASGKPATNSIKPANALAAPQGSPGLGFATSAPPTPITITPAGVNTPNSAPASTSNFIPSTSPVNVQPGATTGPANLSAGGGNSSSAAPAPSAAPSAPSAPFESPLPSGK